jgi:hypothetical protein
MDNVIEFPKRNEIPACCKMKDAHLWWHHDWTLSQNFALHIWMATDEWYEENVDPNVDWDNLETIDIAMWNYGAVMNAFIGNHIVGMDREFLEAALKDEPNLGVFVMRLLRCPDEKTPFLFSSSDLTFIE